MQIPCPRVSAYAPTLPCSPREASLKPPASEGSLLEGEGRRPRLETEVSRPADGGSGFCELRKAAEREEVWPGKEGGAGERGRADAKGQAKLGRQKRRWGRAGEKARAGLGSQLLCLGVPLAPRRDAPLRGPRASPKGAASSLPLSVWLCF